MVRRPIHRLQPVSYSSLMDIWMKKRTRTHFNVDSFIVLKKIFDFKNFSSRKLNLLSAAGFEATLAGAWKSEKLYPNQSISITFNQKNALFYHLHHPNRRPFLKIQKKTTKTTQISTIYYFFF